MGDNSIQSLMKTTMESIREMVDVNTIIGNAVDTPDGTVIIPVSKVTFGFAAGGGGVDDNASQSDMPLGFGGGSGAGVSVRPVGFLVSSPGDGVRFLHVEGNCVYDRILDYAPKVVEKIQELLDKKNDSNAPDNGTGAGSCSRNSC